MLSVSMPKSPEFRPEHSRQLPNPEIPIRLNGVTSVEWFGHVVSQVNKYFDKNPDLDKTEREQIITEITAKLHGLHEEWHYLALFANVNNDVNSEFMGSARGELGIIRQTLIGHGIRPQLSEEFVYRTDLTSNGQRLFSLVKENSVEISELQTLAGDAVDGFDLGAAIIELRTWGFLNENNQGQIGLNEHPDLNSFQR